MAVSEWEPWYPLFPRKGRRMKITDKNMAGKSSYPLKGAGEVTDKVPYAIVWGIHGYSRY